MDKENDFVLSDEAVAEQEKTAVVDENFRSKFVEDLGLSDDDDSKDLIDRLVERETKLRAGYGELLGKKYIPLKQKYQELSTQINAGKDNKSLTSEEIRNTAKEAAFSEINDNFLDESDYSDELKGKIREELKRNPGKTALWVTKNSDFVQFHLNKELEAKKAAEAANNGNGEGLSSKTEGVNMPDKFNDPAYMITEEGRKEYAEWEKANKK